jgi:hypothetical protein
MGGNRLRSTITPNPPQLGSSVTRQFKEKIMISTLFLNRVRTQSGLATLNMFVLAGLLFLSAIPQAGAQTVTLPNRALQNTSFQTQNVAVTATCAVANCTASRRIFKPVLSMICPVGANFTCTYYIHLESQDHFLSILDAGKFRFLVDGTQAVPGPGEGNGFFTWDNNDPHSDLAVPQDHSFAVVATVTNEVANQAHTIEVDIACTDTDASGSCTATSLLSSLEVNVYTP